MNELKTTASLVKQILEEDKQARNSDSFLYFRVLEYHGSMKGIDIHSMSIPTFLLNMSFWGFPPFESVRRNRQLVQSKHPELAPDSQVKRWRGEQQENYLEHAREMKGGGA